MDWSVKRFRRRPPSLADEAMRRRLIWVPIIHTPEDMGKLRGAVRLAHDRGGVAQWEAYVRAAGEFWRAVRVRIERLDLDLSNVRLYQDALPICGYEEKIVRELAHTGAANYRLLVDLTSRGALLTGTESPRLLVEEYELSRKALEGKLAPDHEQRAKSLLQERDRFIANRIEETLETDKVGLIFLGRAHSLEGLFSVDVELQRLDPVDISH